MASPPGQKARTTCTVAFARVIQVLVTLGFFGCHPAYWQGSLEAPW